MRFVDSLNSIQNSLTHTKFETGVVIQNKAVNRSDKSRDIKKAKRVKVQKKRKNNFKDRYSLDSFSLDS